jgi:hypothetical protein
VIVSSLFGFSLVCLNVKVLRHAYLTIVALIISLEIGLVAYVGFYQENAIKDLEENDYQDSFEKDRMFVEKSLHCCGFHSYNASEENCGYQYDEQLPTPSCESKIKEILDKWENRFIAGGVVLFVIETLLVVFTAYLACCYKPTYNDFTTLE